MMLTLAASEFFQQYELSGQDVVSWPLRSRALEWESFAKGGGGSFSVTWE
jgi:hypothetical protein